MKMSDMITQQILALLDQSEQNIAEIQRNEMASILGCVPSQINYVLASRFTPEHGYLIESRRGGGGYIRITRVRLSRSSALMHLVNSIGGTLDGSTARVLVENSLQNGLLEEKAAKTIEAALSALREVPPPQRERVRAALLKQMLLAQI